jgi:hypothetical protein
MDFLTNYSQTIGAQSKKNREKRSRQTLNGTPNSYDAATGLFSATTPDGGEFKYRPLKSTAQPNTINLVLSRGASVAGGDWQ